MNFEALSDYLCNYFRGQGLQEADVDDIVQTALLKIHQARASYDPVKGNLTTWALTIAKRCQIDRYRKRKPEPGIRQGGHMNTQI